MSDTHLRRDSHKTKYSRIWWYEDNRGIDVVVHPHETCVIVNITWRALRAALERKDRKP